MKTAYIHIYGTIDAHSVEDFHELILKDISPETEKLYITLCTDGGSVSHGIAFYNLLRTLPYKIAMHNISNVDSIGVAIFLAAEERYAEENATFLIHPVNSTLSKGKISYNAAKEKMSSIEADMQRIKKIIRDNTGIDPQKLDDLFQTGDVKTAEDARKIGLIRDIKPAPFHRNAFVLKTKATS